MLKKVLLPAVVTSGTVFFAFCLLLSVLRTKPVDIRIQDEQVFSGGPMNKALPQMGVILSLGAGLVSMAVSGWRESERQSSVAEKQLSTLCKDLSAKESQIEALKLSPPQPVAKEKVRESQPIASPVNASNAELIVIPVSSIVAEPLVITDSVAPASKTAIQLPMQSAVSLFASAQFVLGLTRHGANHIPVTTALPTMNPDKPDTPASTPELQYQVQQLLAQIKLLEEALQATTEAAPLEVIASTASNQLSA